MLVLSVVVVVADVAVAEVLSAGVQELSVVVEPVVETAAAVALLVAVQIFQLVAVLAPL